VGTEGSEVVFRKPVVYQPATDSGQRTRDIVEGKYVIRAGQRVTFAIASYDKTRPLVIDPTLVYSAHLGGSDPDFGTGITVDASGHAYLTGNTESADFPTTPGAFQTTKPGVDDAFDAFVTKLNAAGSALLYSTFLGGNDIDNGTGIGVDAAANTYVTGYSFSSNFPTIPGAFQTTFGGVVEAFVAKLATPVFAGTPGRPNCHGESVTALAREFGGLESAAAALGFPSVQALQDAIREFCEE
jgi:Beta-propeller repeat